LNLILNLNFGDLTFKENPFVDNISIILTIGKSDEEINELIRQIEGSCLRFDKNGSKALTVDQVSKNKMFFQFDEI